MFKLFKKATSVPLINAMRLSPGLIAHYPDFKTQVIIEKYVDVDSLYSIIRFLATTAASVPVYEYDAQGNEIETELMSRPNINLSKFEFFEVVYTNLLLHGEVFIAKTNSGITKRPIDLRPLNPLRVVINANTLSIESYDYLPLPGGTKLTYQADEIVHIKYYNPNDEMRGLSPIKVLMRALHLLDTTQNVKQAQMQNGGLDSIVFEKTIDGMDNGATITQSRKANFMKFISNPSNKGVPYFANGDMGAIKLGNTLADMQVIESEKVTFKRLCNVYGTSDILFNSDTASTESNVKEMIKRTYTNTIIPNISRVIGALSHSLNTTLKYDISEIPELQDDLSDLINSLNTAYWLTPNEKREAMKYDTVSDPMFDSYFIPNSVRPIDDLQMPEL